MKLLQVVTLAALWVLLWGDLSVANVLAGLLLGSVLVWSFRLPKVARGARVNPWYCLRLLVWFLGDLIVSAVNVAWLAVRVGRPPVNAVLAVTLRTHADLTMTVVALTLSAAPGNLVIEVRRSTGTLYMHVLGIGDPSAIERVRQGVLDLEKRVIKAIGDQEDRRLLEEEGG